MVRRGGAQAYARLTPAQSVDRLQPSHRPARLSSCLGWCAVWIGVIVGCAVSFAAVAAEPGYAAGLRAAQQALEAGRVNEALRLLKAYRPAGNKPNNPPFEWRHLWYQAHRQAASNSANPAQHRDVLASLPPDPVASRLFILPWERKLVSTGTNLMVALFNLDTLELVEEIIATRRPLDLRPDGYRLLTDGEGGLQIWDSRARALAPMWLAAPTGDWSAAAFLPTDWIAALPSPAGAILLMDVATVGPDKLVGQFQAHPRPIGALAFSPDGTWLASGGADGLIKVWHWQKQRALATLRGHQGRVTVLRFSPDSKLLASGSADGTVRLWDVARQAARATLQGHSGPIHAVAFTPDGYTLATASAEPVVRLWTVSDGQLVAELQCPEAGAQGVAGLVFASDGSVLAARAVTGSIRLWRAPKPETIVAADKPSGRGQ